MIGIAFLCIWLAGVVLVPIAANVYVSWQQTLERFNNNEEFDYRFGSILVGMFWPPVLCIMLVKIIALAFDAGVRESALFYKERAERRALAERAAKELADARHYEIERGPHR